MTAIYKEFHLKTRQAWEPFLSFIKEHAQNMIDKGTPLRLIVTSSEAKRNTEQNRRYWGYVLKSIADQAWVDGQKFAPDVWHEYFARRYGVCEDMKLPGGEVITRRMSTTEMSVGTFTEYMQNVEAHAATELGVQFVQ
jgi:hypothetical protein